MSGEELKELAIVNEQLAIGASARRAGNVSSRVYYRLHSVQPGSRAYRPLHSLPALPTIFFAACNLSGSRTKSAEENLTTKNTKNTKKQL